MLHGRTGIALTLFVFDVLAVETKNRGPLVSLRSVVDGVRAGSPSP